MYDLTWGMLLRNRMLLAETSEGFHTGQVKEKS